ncbi:unnamed protein product [Rotaria magnacalcarata]|uniref:TraB domain-containing protein n=1 Tax=Rotaria magnacalcarata TaxID=392030 RepID=A0A816N240_9BILA|nr:unnamed protein product [Rotaria magnacalcarata]CAF1552675.1 unnamed protein product [Rotaria magnacalcarata]CAF2027842.1 unnamed protein product [Rotaria magnacalcarata]CAF2157471.1 unnamed protein product [Rotaria magnacalcarata]CAF3792164.1 unnamed protein product [Rotaria magnacalcarata]
MDTYVPEEHILQSENDECLINEQEDIELIDKSSKTITTYDDFSKSEQISKRKHCQPSELPETITILKDETTDGTIYLVGTAHFSEKSQREVAEIIQLTQPDIVMVELCQSRVNILSLDENTLMKEASEMNYEKLRTIIKANGVIHGIIHVLLLNMTAHLTKQLGMAPGGEFRTAFREAQKVPGCNLVLGDRPVGITLKRAINSLSTWKKIRLVWSLLTSKDKITNEDVEKCMEQDMLEKFLLEMSDHYPELSRVFVTERDQFLSYSLRKCTQKIPIETNQTGFVPATVVGVVGIGHVQGIIKQWNQPAINDIQHLMNLTIDDKTTGRSSLLPYASLSLKIACIGAVVAGIVQYTRYRLR